MTKSFIFFGNLQVKPDPKTGDAIKQMQSLINKQQLSSFLSMMTYLFSYIKYISDLTFNLRGLPKKHALFQWTESYDVAFHKIKDQISEDVSHWYCDITKDVALQVDASEVGLGAVLLQDSKPIAYISKLLTPANKRYANIEKEMLDVLLGCLNTITICMIGSLHVSQTINYRSPFNNFIRCATQVAKVTT